MSSTITLDALMVIIDALDDFEDTREIKACSLLCREVTHFAQRKLFSIVRLSRDDTMRGMTMLRTRHFLDLVVSQPRFGSYVKDLEINEFFPSQPSAPYDREVLPQILERLTSVRELRIILNFKDFATSPALEDALFALAQMRTIQVLKLHRIIDVPIDFLDELQNIRKLSIFDTTFEEAIMDDESMMIDSKPSPRVLEFHSIQPNAGDVLFLGPNCPFDVSRLETLIVKHVLTIEFERFSTICGASLQDLIIDDDDADADDIGNFRLTNLSNLSTLVMRYKPWLAPSLNNVLRSLPSPNYLMHVTFLVKYDDDLDAVFAAFLTLDDTLSRLTGTIVHLEVTHVPEDKDMLTYDHVTGHLHDYLPSTSQQEGRVHIWICIDCDDDDFF